MYGFRMALAGLSLAALCLSAQAQYQAKFLERSKAWGSVVADFNRDGHQDFMITGHDADDRIWYWTANGYVATSWAFPHVDRHDCDAADVDLDGLIDLYCAVGAVKGTGIKSNELWMQQPGGQFVQAVNYGAEDPSGRSRIPKFFDFNHDGYPDLYVTVEATARQDGLPNINHVYVNQAGHGFLEVNTLATGARGMQCVAKGDIDGDGWDDLLVCSEKGLSHLYLNNRAGDFTELASPAIAGEWTDAALADVNNDGRVDLLLVNTANEFQVWLNTGRGAFFEAPAFKYALPNRPASLTVGDFDHDGRQDVYVVLEDSLCRTSGTDLAPDLVFWGAAGGGWSPQILAQSLSGCGHLAEAVDGDKVLLENGGVGWRGPNYMLSWVR